MTDPIQPVRLIAMSIAESFRPFHEMLDGEVAHFRRQGFTDEQAHALAAAEFVATLGAAIGNRGTLPELPDDDQT
jgi:hypothetical protein